MKPVGWIGVVCLVAGALILALRGVSYTKDRQTVSVGPMSVSAEQRGFVPPYVGLVLLAVGGVLVFSGRGRKT